MKYIRFLILAGLVFLLGWSLNGPINMGGTSLPPLGRLLSPFTGFLQNADPSPQKPSEEIIQVNGINEMVKIVFDDRLVPHIYAMNLEDAYYAQGYVHAMHRLFQMDITSRAVSGRLSEVLGNTTLGFDKMMVRRGMRFAAENALAGWKKQKETMSLLESYCLGVNNFIKQLKVSGQIPVEYKILDFEPGTWAPINAAQIYKSMAYDLSFRNEDLEASASRALLGDSLFQFIYPYLDDGIDPVVPGPYVWVPDSVYKDPANLNKGIIPYGTRYPHQPERNIGSNNWALSGSKTASGAPLLANDPHLGLSLPSVWYEVHIVTPDINVRGVTLPGIPSVIIGFNENIAWGLTNGSQDVLNWYEIDWVDRQKGTYLLDGVKVEAFRRIEKIKVKDGNESIDTILYTVFGPMVQISDSLQLSMQWMAHKNFEMDELGAFRGINAAKDYDDFKKSLKLFSGPAQNFVFASVNGDIGLILSGKLPKWSESKARFVQKGNKIRQARPDFIVFDHLPQVKNPPRGFVSSANQVSVDSSYPYDLFGYYENFRNRHLNNRLGKMQGATPEDMMQVQLDNYNLEASEFIYTTVSGILDRNGVPESLEPWVSKFRNWDFKFEKDEELPTLYVLWFREFYNKLWDELKVGSTGRLLLPELWRMVDLMQDDPSSLFFDRLDTEETENAHKLLVMTLDTAIQRFKRLPDEVKPWGKYKASEIRHIARVPGFGESIDNGGHGSALNAMTRTNGPSWRMVVSLEKPIRAYGVYPGGQSGNPGSFYYDQSLENWVNGEYFELELPRSSDKISNFTKKLTLSTEAD